MYRAYGGPSRYEPPPMVLWPVYHNKMAWAAGVLDGRGRLGVRGRDSGVALTVYATVSQEMGELLVGVLGGTWQGGKWYVRAKEQRQALRRIVPYLRNKKLYDRLSKALVVREVGPAYGRDAVRRFQEKVLGC